MSGRAGRGRRLRRVRSGRIGLWYYSCMDYNFTRETAMTAIMAFLGFGLSRHLSCTLFPLLPLPQHFPSILLSLRFILTPSQSPLPNIHHPRPRPTVPTPPGPTASTPFLLLSIPRLKPSPLLFLPPHPRIPGRHFPWNDTREQSRIRTCCPACR